jgi:hypothetical protein
VPFGAVICIHGVGSLLALKTVEISDMAFDDVDGDPLAHD